MNLRPPDINRINLWNRIAKIKRLSKRHGDILLDSRFYLKPSYIPWSKEVWVSRSDVFLPFNFEEKIERHQVHDLFIAAELFDQHATRFMWFSLTMKASLLSKQYTSHLIRYHWKMLKITERYQ